jgi:hypothetical protein
MNVGELIQKLAKFDFETEVSIYFGDTRLEHLKDESAERAMDPWLEPVDVSSEVSNHDCNPALCYIHVIDEFQEPYQRMPNGTYQKRGYMELPPVEGK